MPVSKVNYKGRTLLDISRDTVKADKLMAGYTAHDSAGNLVIGTASAGVDTTDATATANDILKNKTAYVKGSKITGTCTFDSDTSDATATANDIVRYKTAYVNGSKVTGNIVNRGNLNVTLNPGSQQSVNSGYYTGGTVKANAAPEPNLQSKYITITPGANWTGTETDATTINPDSGYDGMSSVDVRVPMCRDYLIFNAKTVDTPSTLYNGTTVQSNSEKALRIAPTKDGMVYTNSYVYLKKDALLGNATPEDVASGKTFSSASGIQITGTGASKSGLPCMSTGPFKNVLSTSIYHCYCPLPLGATSINYKRLYICISDTSNNTKQPGGITFIFDGRRSTTSYTCVRHEATAGFASRTLSNSSNATNYQINGTNRLGAYLYPVTKAFTFNDHTYNPGEYAIQVAFYTGSYNYSSRMLRYFIHYAGDDDILN